MLKIRPVWKADELKRFGELEEKYHYMGETHSGGDTLDLDCEDVRTRRCNANIIGAMMLARTPAFVFMAKRGVANSQAFKEELQSDHALPLRMVVDAPSN